jgi:hypothetical protein
MTREGQFLWGLITNSVFDIDRLMVLASFLSKVGHSHAVAFEFARGEPLT